MRCLNRNKRVVYYKNYLGVEQILDDNGLRTGEYETSYGELKCEKMNVSPSSGVAMESVFGIGNSYARAAVTSNTKCELDEYSIVWVFNDLKEEYSEEKTYSKGDIVIKDGNLSIFDGATWSSKSNDYLVMEKAESINSIAYGLREVASDE